MSTLIRFYDRGDCISTIYLYYDNNYILKDVIYWLESHNVGHILFIISAFRLYLRNKYGPYMYLQEPTSKKKDISNKYDDRPVGYIIDIGKYMDSLFIKLTHIENKREIIDTPKMIRYKLNL